MWKNMLFMSFLITAILCRHSLADDEAIQEVFDELVAADHWREQSVASDRLAEFGEAALPQILKGTEHNDEDVREYCYRILYNNFVSDSRSYAALIRGLKDPHSPIVYSCAFWLGEAGNENAVPSLRKAMKESSKIRIRYAAAKSLAELGEEDVIVTLYYGLGNDNYMPRYLCNRGIKAMTEKDLNDFDYHYSEGAFVSGGNEMKFIRRPIHDAELKASRFRAIATYCQWLKDEKPSIYRLLDPNEPES